MDKVIDILITLICTLFASGGFWILIQKIIDKKLEKKDVQTRMLIGLGHDKILYLGKSYLERGSITMDEYENLHDYLFVPYEEMGGNGSAKRIMDEVNTLPIVNNPEMKGGE